MENWSLIVGLGNPGAKYERTRHNAGFLLVDRLAAEWSLKWEAESRFRALVARTNYLDRAVMLIKPQTFMNASGEAIGSLMQFYRIIPDRLLVVVDDADLAIGTIRLRPNGSSGGHHGLESIGQHIGGTSFARQRIGIGRIAGAVREITGHVLGRFDEAEWSQMQQPFARAGRQAKSWLSEGVQKAMNQYNGAGERPTETKDSL